MKLETFFQKFDQFADAPDAVDKMRELVLQLAVQGKLVDQKRSDGSAAQLLASISSERGALAAKLRTPSEPASASGDEPSFPIPSNWAWTQLGKIALQIQYGYTASADRNATEIRMLRITDIQDNRVDWSSVPGCQIESDEAEKYLLGANDILIARTGGTIGKSFIVSDAPVKAVFASYLIRVTPPHSMAARYLKAFLESPLYWAQLRQMSAGTGQPNVNGQALGRLQIPLPPLAEQWRIVAKVDELMALCDRLAMQQRERKTRHADLARASLARFADAPIPANLPFIFHPYYDIPPADLRKSILTVAIQGKLVAQDPNDEPADALLARITSTGAQDSPRRNKSQPELAFTPDEVPFELPPGWEWERLGNIGETNIGLTYSPQDVSDVGIPVLRSSNVQDGKLDFADLVRVTCEPKQSVMVQDGDLLICARNGSRALVGKVAVIEDLKEPAAFGAFMAIFRSELNQYLYHFIRSPLFRQMIDEVNTTTINQITQANLRSTLAPIPPLAEQRRIVAKVEQLMVLVDELELQIAASRATAANLLSALVAELTTHA